MTADIVGGFPIVDPNCAGCGLPLTIENAWMTDGCPCNSSLGVNNQNETRWRLLMELQQRQAREAESLKALLVKVHDTLKNADIQRLKETDEAHAEAAKWKAEGDMYGWNFHEGRAGGTTAASIIFYRAWRVLDDSDILGVKK